MVERSSLYNRLATREGFNTSVRHINRTLDLLDICGPKKNIADEINQLILEKAFDEEAILSAINMLLVEKAGYSTATRNINAITTDPASVCAEISKIKAVDIVIGYHHPDLGFIVINPKNPTSEAVVAGFRKNELIVVYAGVSQKTETTQTLARSAATLVCNLIEGKKVTIPAALLTGSYTYVAPPKPKVAGKEKNTKTLKAKNTTKKTVSSSWVSPAQVTTQTVQKTVNQTSAPAPVAQVAAPGGASRMTPLISVVVSNELFHNGNVEAWKRIIRSYNAKYPNLNVFIYYDGERIVDINTLFKWGKVKHGSCIQFCVSGENIQDLAKLSRYFKQGASPQFEAFLHGSPDTVMNLF